MMDLLMAILIALGSLTSRADFNDEYIRTHEVEVAKARTIIDNGQYTIRENDGGVIVEPGVGL